MLLLCFYLPKVIKRKCKAVRILKKEGRGFHWIFIVMQIVPAEADISGKNYPQLSLSPINCPIPASEYTCFKSLIFLQVGTIREYPLIL